MIVFPNAKINLGLHVTGRRPDGYHNIETVMVPVALTDLLEIIPCEVDEMPEFVESGILSGVAPERNLCLMAVRKIEESVKIPPLKIALHKQIPNGAGLGGGSADAVFTLVLLNHLFECGLSRAHLVTIASEIGSDCPFFIYNKPMLASGRGEILEEISMNHGTYHISIVKPPFSCDTKSAYQSVEIRNHSASVRDLVRRPVSEWRHQLHNVFENIQDDHHKIIREIKQKVYESGAVYASMTGSGSAVYGLFEEKPAPMYWPQDYFTWYGMLDLNTANF